MSVLKAAAAFACNTYVCTLSHRADAVVLNQLDQGADPDLHDEHGPACGYCKPREAYDSQFYR